ncbi:MAG: hypothetical protein QNJ41_15150 [Xenococcaceae cyanobacterium MO_188.B32]|nr:hypothetical protein [Xenococcaceae cyanobacterium MO_188.B32]
MGAKCKGLLPILGGFRHFYLTFFCTKNPCNLYKLKLIRYSANPTYVRDVVVKQVPQQRLIGIRKVLPTADSGDDFFWSVMNALPGGNDTSYGAMTIVLHGDGVTSDRTDVELGRLLHKTDHAPLTTYDGMTLGTRSLPPATMATFIPPTSCCSKLLGYNALGEWAEANHYAFAGPVRLVFLELPKLHLDDLFFATMEVVSLSLIVWCAWKWRKQEA